MSGQDPLRQKRLGLRGVLLVSGGVLLASSVFLVPNLGLLQGSTPTTSLAVPAVTSSPTADDGSDTSAGSTSAAASSLAAPALLPVYWLGEVDGDARLFREFLTTQDQALMDPIGEAVRVMTAGDPLDPDYSSPWAEASSVSSSISTQNVITVDISSDAFAVPLPEAQARIAVQQLVYTATAAASNAGLIKGGEASSVVVLVDGAAGYRAFGTVDLDGEWTRDSAVLAPVWIIDPQQNVQVDGVVTVNGLAPTTEDAVSWRIDRLADSGTPGAGELFRTGSAEVRTDETVAGTYSFSETLPSGRYVITVSAPTRTGAPTDTKNVVVL